MRKIHPQKQNKTQKKFVWVLFFVVSTNKQTPLNSREKSHWVFFCVLQISVLTVADAVRTCSLDQCYKTYLSPATSETKRKMSTFVSSVKPSDSPTQHAVGFHRAFQLIRSTSNSTRFQASTCIRERWPRCYKLGWELEGTLYNWFWIKPFFTIFAAI
jgi:hypothetical protein